MNETWQTIEQAAVTLGVSVRTINRHITGGKYPSRLVDGRREVLITLPEPTVPVPDEEPPEPKRRPVERENGAAANGSPVGAAHQAAPQPAAATATATPSYDNVSGQSEMMLAISDNWRDQNELVASAYQTLARNAEQFARSRQRSARVAWSIVGVVTVAVVAAVGWTVYSITDQRARLELYQQRMADAQTAVDRANAEADKYRTAWTTANERTSRVLENRVGGMIDPTAHGQTGSATLAGAPTPATPAPSPPPASPPTQPATQPAAVPVPPPSPAPAPAPSPGPTPAAGPGVVQGAGNGNTTPPGVVAPRPATLPAGTGAIVPGSRG